MSMILQSWLKKKEQKSVVRTIFFCQQIHNHRVQLNGMDYVQNSYLNSHSSESSSSLDCFSSLDLRDISQIFPESSQHELEEISRLCDDLAHVERRLVEEMAKIQDIQPEVERLSGQLGLESAMEGETDAELEDTRVSFIALVRISWMGKVQESLVIWGTVIQRSTNIAGPTVWNLEFDLSFLAHFLKIKEWK